MGIYPCDELIVDGLLVDDHQLIPHQPVLGRRKIDIGVLKARSFRHGGADFGKDGVHVTAATGG